VGETNLVGVTSRDLPFRVIDRFGVGARIEEGEGLPGPPRGSRRGRPSGRDRRGKAIAKLVGGVLGAAGRGATILAEAQGVDAESPFLAVTKRR
jgi:hypothetical protein